MEAGEEGQALQPEFWASREACIVCGSDAFQPGYGPQTMVTCECCLDNGVHVECWQRGSGELLTQERMEQPGFEWFCSEVRRPPPLLPPLSEAAAPPRVAAAAGGKPARPPLLWQAISAPSDALQSLQGCRRVSERLVELTGMPQPLEGTSGGAVGEYRWAEQVAVRHVC